MWIHRVFSCLARLVVASLSLALVGLMTGCEGDSPTRPAPPVIPSPALNAPIVTDISPATGSTVSPVLVTISGTGFVRGATVTVAAASAVSFINETRLTAIVPAHPTGPVDVVVTNPDGQSGRLNGAFTFAIDEPYTIAANANAVAPGAQLSVSWTAPRAGAADWVGLFRVGAPNTSFEEYWWKYTDGVTSGSATLTAPLRPGQYEFRFLLNDGYVDAARSSPVSVIEAVAVPSRVTGRPTRP